MSATLPRACKSSTSTQATTTLNYWNMSRPQQVVGDGQNNFWVADSWHGLHRLRLPDGGETFVPQVPYNEGVFGLTARNGEVWVSSGGFDVTEAPNFNRSGAFQYLNNTWNLYNEYHQPALSGTTDYIETIFHPSQNKIYIATYGSGLIEFDGQQFIVYQSHNSPIQPVIGTPWQHRVGGMAFDAEENLWLTNYGSVGTNVVVKKADGTWQAFTPTVSIANRLSRMVVDDSNQKWIIDWQNGVLVMNTGNDLANTTDDQYKMLSMPAMEGSTTSQSARAIVKDQEGAIWVGTETGVVVYYCPYAIFETGCTGERPIVEVNGFGAYLLSNEVVNALAVDGPTANGWEPTTACFCSPPTAWTKFTISTPPTARSYPTPSPP